MTVPSGATASGSSAVDGAAAAPQVEHPLAGRRGDELDEASGDRVEEPDAGLVVVVGDLVEERLRTGRERGQLG